MDRDLGNKLIALRQSIVANFTAGDWEEIGLLTGHSDMIDNYPRLLRSLSWGDEDYSGNVLGVLRRIAENDAKAIGLIEQFVHQKFSVNDEYVSAKPAVRRITFAPNVFNVPEMSLESDLVAVMMPFNAEFSSVYTAIRDACATANLRCLRVDDIWEGSIVVQDIFNLIFRAQIIIVDFTSKNPNVMYETGIAHTLGKHVVPISQSLSDAPFDLTHHRILKYLANEQGLETLRISLTTRLRQVSQ